MGGRISYTDYIPNGFSLLIRFPLFQGVDICLFSTSYFKFGPFEYNFYLCNYGKEKWKEKMLFVTDYETMLFTNNFEKEKCYLPRTWREQALNLELCK